MEPNTGVEEDVLDMDLCPDCGMKPGGHGMCPTCCEGWDDYRRGYEDGSTAMKKAIIKELEGAAPEKG